MDLFGIASLAARKLHSRGVPTWCGLHLANALDGSRDASLQRAAAAFRATASGGSDTMSRSGGFREICNAYSEGNASGDLIRCHTAACFLALYFKARRQSNQVRSWLQVATDKARALVDQLGVSDPIEQQRLFKLIERLEITENESASISAVESTIANPVKRMWEIRQAATFFISFHNRRIQLITGVGAGKYLIA